jgi:hypothetical protein
MSGIFWTDTDNGLFVFLLLTVLGGAAAMATGRALAKGWSPMWMIIPAIALLSAAVRFLHFSLFQEDLGSLHYYLVTLVVLLVVAWLSYKSMRATQMSTQYSWSYEKAGISWRPR